MVKGARLWCRPSSRAAPSSRRARDQALLLKRGQGRQAGGHGEIVLGECGAVHERPVHAVEYPIEHLAPARDRADRDEAARERLGEQHQVRLDSPVF
jgi:hypothetical protein